MKTWPTTFSSVLFCSYPKVSQVLKENLWDKWSQVWQTYAFPVVQPTVSEHWGELAGDETSTSNFLYFPFLIIQLSYDSAHEKLIDRLSRSEALMCPFFHWYIELLQYAGF